jgi:hypothetical protein
MTISGQPALSLLDSVLNAESARVDIGVAVLKRAQDLTKQQGAALVEMLEQAGAAPDCPRLDVYA